MRRPKGSKNKAKLDPPVFDKSVIADLVSEREGIVSIKAFCEKKGFPLSELIARFEGLEAELSYYLQNPTPSPMLNKPIKDVRQQAFLNQVGEIDSFREMAGLPIGQNKPNTAPKTEKEGKTTPKQEKSKEGAENGGESKPKELSPFLKSRQNLKNGIK